MAGCCEAGPGAPSPSRAPWPGSCSPEARVGFVGRRRGSGVSWLVRALAGQPLCPWGDPWAYFRRKESPPEAPAPHRHFPQLALHDLGPLPSAPPEPPLSSFRCLVLVTGPEEEEEEEGEGPAEPPLRALRRAAPRAALLLVRTGADALRHSERRRAGLWGRGPAGEGAWRGRAQGALEEAMRREGLDPSDAFLLSALQPRRYDLARFEQRLALRALGLDTQGRAVPRSPPDASAANWKRAEELFQACQPRGLLQLPPAFRSALEDPEGARLEVALVGEAGPLKSCLLRALRGGGAEEEEEGAPRKARPLGLLPALLPRAFLREVSPAPPLDLGRYDLVLLLGPQEGEAHKRLIAAVASTGKEAFLVQSKAEAQRRLQEGGGEEEGGRHGAPPPRAFLLPDDLPLLLEALRSGGPGWKRQALRSALPGALSLLVAEKAGALRREAWERALGPSTSSSPQEAATELLASLGGFRRELGLEEAFLQQAVDLGPDEAAEVLRTEARSPFARPMGPEALLELVTGPPSLGSWAWSFVPFFGWGAQAEARVSFADAYRVLQRAVTELAEDAERVLRRALLEE